MSLLAPEDIADLSYSELRDACKALDLPATGTGKTLRARLTEAWEATQAEPLTALDEYASALIDSLDTSRFDNAAKRVPFAVRALKRSGADIEGLTEADLAEVIRAAYARRA